MTLLDWREATPADSAAVQGFTCAPKPVAANGRQSKRIQTRPWEETVQKAIHTLDLAPAEDAAVLLGFDDDGLAAVAVVVSQDSPQYSLIEGIAVARRRRKQGGTCADEAMDEALNWACRRADDADYEVAYVAGFLDPRNAASRHLLERSGFELFAKSDDCETWRTALMV